MGFRNSIAGKYAGFTQPQIWRSHSKCQLPAALVSASLLFRARITVHLSHPVVRPRVAENVPASPFLAKPSICELPVSPRPAGTRDASSFLDASVDVSANLLKPLLRPEAKGKDYTSGKSKSSQHGVLAAEASATWRKKGPTKAYAEIATNTGPIRLTSALWDLILPLLKPPLDLDFPQQLDLPSPLYPFQLEGVKQLVSNKHFLLADEMGTGKTVMTCVALRILFHKAEVHKALIVCPANVLSVWDQHLGNWGGTSGLRYTIVHGSADVRARDWKCRAHIYVTSYDTLRSDVLGQGVGLSAEELAEFDLVVLDEAHAIRNASSGKTRAVLQLHPQYRWALSGTPLQNRVDDLISIFAFVKPGLFASVLPVPAEIRKRCAPHFLRRLKKDVMSDLPPKVHQEMWLELDSDQRQEYDSALALGRSELKSHGAGITRIHVFALLQKLKLICNFATRKNNSPKLTLLLEQLNDIIDDHKAVVFSQYLDEGVHKMRQPLQQYGCVEITGASTLTDRRRAVEQFQQADDARVFLGSLKAAGEGITLTAGNYVFLFDHWWNPAVSWQAVDRVHRQGQKSQVTVYSYWMSDTIEERIYDVLAQKGLLHEEIINAMSETEINESITMEEWSDILGLEIDFGKKGHSPRRLRP